MEPLITKSMVEEVRKLSYAADSDSELHNYLWHKGIVKFSWEKFYKDLAIYRKYAKGETSVYKEGKENHAIKKEFYEAVEHIRKNCQSYLKSRMMDHVENDLQGYFTVKVYQTLFAKEAAKAEIIVNNTIENNTPVLDIDAMLSLSDAELINLIREEIEDENNEKRKSNN